MERGAIDVADIPGGLDLQATIESGQTYLWRRADGETYDATGAHGGTGWYRTVVAGEAVQIRQRGGLLEWEGTTDATPLLNRLLRLDDDLEAIIEATPTDPLIDAAYAAYQGMRIVRDPFFPCCVSFICSAQMRVSRIFGMQEALRETYGESVTFGETTLHAFPTPERLAAATEAELRDLGLGYRAPYVVETARDVANGNFDPATIPDNYETARATLTELAGVGDKVADCVLLFSLGYLEAVPLDTWIRTAIKEYYPACDRGSYAETSRAIRETFGPYAGYTQTYVFHHLRHSH